jgi:predicted MFS family arabinose efflux permease
MSRTTLGTTQGILMGAYVIGFIGGNLSGGWLADAFGFQSIPWAVAGLSVAALFLGYLAVSRRRSQHSRKVAGNTVGASP